MTDTAAIPKLSEVTAVRLAITVEVWPYFPDAPHLYDGQDHSAVADEVVASLARARGTIRDYLRPLRDALPDDDPRAEVIDDDAAEVVPSDYDRDVYCVEGSAHLTLTPAEWLVASRGWCLDLDWTDDGRTYDPERIPALPADQLTATLGILDETGVIPAVAIEGTQEGWGYGGYEPDVLASFYVALAVPDRKDR